MKNEKKVDFTLHYSNGTRPPFYNKGEEPSIISAYGYDYIREDKCMKWEKMEEINRVDIEYCKCPHEEEELKVGDVVVLKSGSPLMTIIRFDEDEWAVCSWYSEMGEEYLTTPFPIGCIEEVEKEYTEDEKIEIDIEPIKEMIKEMIKEKSINYKEKYAHDGLISTQLIYNIFYDGAYWMLNELVGNE